ncbi:bacteriocin immunity protein [Salmonella enterica]|nr:bacteriocin immunity protein [Salmonella enterica]
MEKKTLSDYTEAEFLEFVRNMCRVEGETEADDDKLVDEFERLTEHPSFGQRRTSQFSYYITSTHNLSYVKCIRVF